MKAFVEKNSDRFIEELKDFLRIPSVSADSAYKAHIEEASEFLEQALKSAGMDYTTKFYTGGNPIVYAEKIIDREMPTVLVYGHYDVQPADPVELWETPPFEPTVKNGKIYARGACDDKAQVYLVIKALETLNAFGNLPCNLKVMFEGEEETGSGSLTAFVKNNAALLQADVLLICDTSMPSVDKPTLITGLRGISYCEFTINGAPQDLHSGMFGGAVVNPLQVICSLIAKLKDENDVVQIPDFYTGIKSGINLPNTGEFPSFLSNHLKGEANFTALEQITVRPSLDINGIQGGYTEEGPKTIIPSSATAKISMRLVEGQDYAKVTAQLEKYLHSMLPAQCSISFKTLAGCNAITTKSDSEAYKAAHIALKKNFSNEASDIKIGGTIPVVSLIKQELNIEPLLMGFGLDSDNIHAPNESFSLNNFFKGIYTLIDFFKIYSHNYTLINKQTLVTK